jgi:Methyltransferase domain
MLAADTGFGERVAELDTTLFDAIPSQTSDLDRRSLLACQLATRSLRPEYRYLEIGSYRGGSIQPHLLDDSCTAIYSVDKRPAKQPDESGLNLSFPGNSTERMREALARLDDGRLSKLTCIEGDARTLDPGIVPEPIDLCFVDGEHSDQAVEADFAFCRRVIGDRGAIVFHDAQITYNALWKITSELREAGAAFHAYNLPSILMVIELGGFPIHSHAAISPMLLDNHVGYLESLRRNDHFRRWASIPPVRLARRIKARIERTSLSP